MYQVESRSGYGGALGGFGAFGEGTITAERPSGGGNCTATERRFARSAIADPAAADVVTIDPRHSASGRGGIQLHRTAYGAYQRMKAAAERDGIPANLLTITSGYRSSATQRRLFEAAVRRYGSESAARKWVAPPGGSSHQTGRTVDLNLGLSNDSRNVPALRGTMAYRWLVCNAHRFGFTPYSAEPWHWEYNPPAGATLEGYRGYGHGYGYYGETAPPFTCSTADLTSLRTSLRNPGLTLARLQALLMEGLRRTSAALDRAATLLEAHPRSATTIAKFRKVFNASPDTVPSWRTPAMRWRDLGELVAIRLRSARRILDGGQIRFSCLGGSGCTGAIAFTTPPDYQMTLCVSYWQRALNGDWPSIVSTLVHEAIHIFFHRLTSHRASNRRAVNANPSARSNAPSCYGFIVTELNGLPPDPLDTAACPGGDVDLTR